MELLMTAAEVARDRDAWLKVRRGGIGASDIGAIMRLPGSYGSPYALWMIKTGRDTEESPGTRRMRFGLYTENFTAWSFAEEHPELHVTPGGLYARTGRDWQLATFDRLAHYRQHCTAQGACAVAAPLPVQLKIDGWRDYRETGIPLGYRAQVIWETDTAGGETGYLSVLDTSTAEETSFAIERDADWERDLKLMLEAADEFRGLVQRDRPPRTDWLPATRQALIQRYPDLRPDVTARVPYWLARRWRRAARAEDRHRKARKGYENMLRERAGDAGVWVTWDPEAAAEVKVATRHAGPRAGYNVEPIERVDAIYPSRKWTP